jgi:hypothetical protein
MNPLDRADRIRTDSAALLQDLKDQFKTITLDQAHELYSMIREIEGWLMACRNQLEPEQPPYDAEMAR